MALRQAFDYVDAVVEADLNSFDGIERDPERIRRLLRSYSRNISSQAKLSKIRQDMIANDLETFGLLFESMCVRDLWIYADYLDGKVYHYRDQSGLECDAVIHLRNGKYGLIEVKLGGDYLVEEDAKNSK